MGLYGGFTPNERMIVGASLFLGLSLLALVTLLMRHGALESFDRSVLAWFHAHTTPAVRRFFETLTPLGSLKLLAPAALLLTGWLAANAHRREAILFAVGFVGAVATTWTAKYILLRSRPSAVLDADALPSDPSYPSAHTTQSFAFAIMLWLVLAALGEGWRPGAAALLLAAASLVALSRMVLQVHYPSDVAAGMLVAFSWGALTVILAKLQIV
jgi:undecaprenyl-diphosphatase